MPESRDDRAMMLNPMRWPRWPWLPLKRFVKGQGWPQVGLMYADDPDQETGTVRLWTGYPESKLTKTYESLDALLADGWIID